MKAKQTGRAIAAYRQAQRYIPRNPYLDANLQFALGAGAFRPAERNRNNSILAELAELPGKILLFGGLGSVDVLLCRSRVIFRSAAALASADPGRNHSRADCNRFDRITIGIDSITLCMA